MLFCELSTCLETYLLTYLAFFSADCFVEKTLQIASWKACIVVETSRAYLQPIYAKTALPAPGLLRRAGRPGVQVLAVRENLFPPVMGLFVVMSSISPASESLFLCERKKQVSP